MERFRRRDHVAISAPVKPNWTMTAITYRRSRRGVAGNHVRHALARLRSVALPSVHRGRGARGLMTVEPKVLKGGGKRGKLLAESAAQPARPRHFR